MMPVRDLYLGWQPAAHNEPCPAPLWESELRIDEGLRGRLNTGDLVHACQADECGHANVYSRFTVRLICKGCGVVHTISGEDVGIARDTTAVIGYGLPPQELEGLWLWPGEQVLADVVDEPRDWLITHTPNRPRHSAEVAGLICRHRTAGGHLRWQANAIADSTGPYGDDQLRWARRQSDLRSVEKAAEWIGAQYQPQRVAVTV
ncbi:hypothetical protein [Streptomyces sp. NBC_00198]|uniref:hypothetical protein n=1 Tax=Streptomyces sp. NBC_00198 TaxID=2975677 RepID=UPI002253C48B|nr:hypothetical protein [Streptomyces sp. NBC_00198]MCX5285982.1 hypothetical protein [Streptomyces sp. NBC_00198]MCX5286291.1 hypothetical protein [Streptomyces sp. NBC_00198]